MAVGSSSPVHTELQRRSRQRERTRSELDDARRRELLEQDRNRIARELHDNVAQHLLGIGMMLEWCRKQGPPAPVLERLTSSKQLARSALAEIRSAIYGLSSVGDHVDLPAALEGLADELRHITDLEIVVRSRGPAGVLPRAAEHVLTQIAREALFNVARHAEASRAWTTVRHGGRCVVVTIDDDGRGDPQGLNRRLERAAREGGNDHRGLANIAAGARELAASVRFAPRRGGGVRLSVKAPLPALKPDWPV